MKPNLLGKSRVRSLFCLGLIFIGAGLTRAQQDGDAQSKVKAVEEVFEAKGLAGGILGQVERRSHVRTVDVLEPSMDQPREMPVHLRSAEQYRVETSDQVIDVWVHLYRSTETDPWQAVGFHIGEDSHTIIQGEASRKGTRFQDAIRFIASSTEIEKLTGPVQVEKLISRGRIVGWKPVGIVVRDREEFKIEVIGSQGSIVVEVTYRTRGDSGSVRIRGREIRMLDERPH